MAQTSDGCLLCTQSIPQSHLIYEGKHWRIRHSEETNILGYCILEPVRHFLDLSEAETGELADYSVLLAAIMKAQRESFGDCERVYTFSLAEAVPHFHLHVIPRRKDFIKVYKGRGIMSYPLKPAASPELVATVSQQLRGCLRRDQRLLTVC
jgi:histidine triad (HIT) family protein